MLAVYLMALGFGGVLIVANILLGGKEVGDADHGDVGHGDAGHGDVGHGDADHGEVDHADGDHASESIDKDFGGPWVHLTSLRFWTFALAAFGMNGAILTLLSVNAVVAAVVSVLLGLAIGGAVSSVFRRLQRDAVSGMADLRSLAGAEARVLLPISADNPGKVRVVLGGQDVDLMASTQDRHRLERGSRALVVEVRQGVAVVTPLRALPNSNQET